MQYWIQFQILTSIKVFDDQKLNNFTAEKKLLKKKLFAVYLSLGPQEGRPSYRRGL
jgi:hypothetical protein